MSAVITPPTFSVTFFHPKYWLVWMGFGFLYLMTWLPLAWIRKIGHGLGLLLMKLVPKRVNVARRNLALTYPQMSESERETLLVTNCKATGMAVFETVMGWWWPAWRIQRHFTVEGYEHVERILAQGKGVFGLALHNMNLEFACRGLGYTHPSIAFYRKHNNPLIDYFQYHGRARSNKYMIHKRAAKALLEALDKQELCLYLPDQDYGRHQSIFVPFGGVPDTATTTATLMFARRSDSVPIIVTSQYTATGYKVKFIPIDPEFANQGDQLALTYLNQQVYGAILEQPESYLWMHKRFKSRPTDEHPSYYQ